MIFEKTPDIQEQFNKVAEEYDKNRKCFIPCFDDYYKSTTAQIALCCTDSTHAKVPKKILDLGSGTGLLAMYWYEHFPHAEYTLVDIADKMLDIAKKRFENCSDIHYQILDYKKNLPVENFDTIISALSIHHLEHSEKQFLFDQIYAKLPEGGLFVNYDQFCNDDSQIDNDINRLWEAQIHASSLTEDDIKKWQERKKLDRECSIETEMAMLGNSGFQFVECKFSNGKFAVITARK